MNFFLVNYHRQKATLKSPPCMSTGGLKKDYMYQCKAENLACVKVTGGGAMCPQSGIRAMTYSITIVLVCGIFTRRPICNFFAPYRFERKKNIIHGISLSLYLVGVAQCVPLAQCVSLLYTLFDYG